MQPYIVHFCQQLQCTARCNAQGSIASNQQQQQQQYLQQRLGGLQPQACIRSCHDCHLVPQQGRVHSQCCPPAKPIRQQPCHACDDPVEVIPKESRRRGHRTCHVDNLCLLVLLLLPAGCTCCYRCCNSAVLLGNDCGEQQLHAKLKASLAQVIRRTRGRWSPTSV